MARSSIALFPRPHRGDLYKCAGPTGGHLQRFFCKKTNVQQKSGWGAGGMRMVGKMSWKQPPALMAPLKKNPAPLVKHTILKSSGGGEGTLAGVYTTT